MQELTLSTLLLNITHAWENESLNVIPPMPMCDDNEVNISFLE
jgi:hypothetical protein